MLVNIPAHKIHADACADGCDIDKGLPIMLFGHSWGAYSVGNVLNHHPEVSAAVMVAGFNESEEMMGYYPRKVLGGFVDVVLLPYVSFYERVKFGKDYANITAVEGIEGTDAEILVVHSKDDQRVPFNSGYEIYKQAFLGEDRAVPSMSWDSSAPLPTVSSSTTPWLLPTTAT